MSQYYFKEINLLNAQAKYRDRLKELDPILFPRGEKSAMDASTTADDVELAVDQALNRAMGQNTTALNLKCFADAFAGEQLSLKLGMGVRRMIMEIDGKRDVIKRNIDAMTAAPVKSGKTRAFFGGALLGGLLTYVFTPPVSAATNDAANSSSSGGGKAMILLLICAAVAAGAYAVSRKRRGTFRLPLSVSGHASPRNVGSYPCSKEAAMQVYTIVTALADIYRDERQ